MLLAWATSRLCWGGRRNDQRYDWGYDSALSDAITAVDSAVDSLAKITEGTELRELVVGVAAVVIRHKLEELRKY